MAALLQLHHSLKVHYSVLSIRNLKSEIPNIIGTTAHNGICAHWNTVDADQFASGFTGSFAISNISAGGAEYYANSITYKFHVVASYSSDRYGNYTEVNPLYNSCKFFIRY